MDRRGFLSSCITLAAAPAIVRADSLMRIVPIDTQVFTFRGVEIEFDSPPSPQLFYGEGTPPISTVPYLRGSIYMSERGMWMLGEDDWVPLLAKAR